MPDRISENERTKLNSYRYGFTVLSSVAVYAIAFALLKSQDNDKLGFEDVKVFSYLAIIVVAIECVFSLVFHTTVPEQHFNFNISNPVYDQIDEVAEDGQLEDNDEVTSLISTSTDNNYLVGPSIE